MTCSQDIFTKNEKRIMNFHEFSNQLKQVLQDFSVIFSHQKQFDWCKKSWKFRIHSFGIYCWIHWASYVLNNCIHSCTIHSIKYCPLKNVCILLKNKFTCNLLHSNQGYCNLICWPLNNWIRGSEGARGSISKRSVLTIFKYIPAALINNYI